MTACHRFEKEGLDKWLSDEPLDAHFTSCEDCAEALREYRAMAGVLGNDNASARPAAGWEEAVLSTVQEPAVRRPPWLAIAASVSLLGLAFVLMRPQSVPSDFSVSVEQSDEVFRAGNEATLGDTLNVRWQGNARNADGFAIFVYRDGRELVGYCGADAEPCADGNAFSVPMNLPGAYQPVVVVADQAVTAPTGNVDQDVLALYESGVDQVVVLEVVTVR